MLIHAMHVNEYMSNLNICQCFIVFSWRLYWFLYWAFLGVVFAALEIAANLNVTSEHLQNYNYDHGSQRLALEIAAVILWIVFLALDFVDIVRYMHPCCPVQCQLLFSLPCFMHNCHCHVTACQFHNNFILCKILHIRHIMIVASFPDRRGNT